MGKENGTSKPKKRRAKGHRQRGAGTVATSRGIVSHAGVTMAEWQRSPKQLLYELCQSKKRPRPIWRHVRGTRDGKFRFRVVLPDPKKVRERDLVFTPSQTFSSKVEAEHMVALLALHHFDATRPHERRLPEPYRTAWLSLVKTKDTSSKSDKKKTLSKQELKKQMKERRAKYKEFRSSAIKRGETNIPVFEEWCDKNDDRAAEKEEIIVKTRAVKNVVKVEEMDDSGRPKQKCFHFFQHGECRYGNKCRFSHGKVQVTSRPAETTNTTTTTTTISSVGKYASQRERNVARIEKNKKRAEARSKREARKRKFQAPRVMMSEKRRNEIARLLRSVRNAWNAEIDRKNRSLNKTKKIVKDVETEKQIMNSLVRFGFSRKIAQIAIRETREKYQRYEEENSKQMNLADVLSWLLIYCPTENLPEKFNVKTVQVASTVSDDSPELKRLVSFGFERSICVRELEERKNSFESALYVLYTKCFDLQSKEEEDDEEEEEEDSIEALKAIYGDEVEEVMSLDELKKRTVSQEEPYCKEWLRVRFEEIDGMKGEGNLVFFKCFGGENTFFALFHNKSLSKGELQASNEALSKMSGTLFDFCSFVQDGMSEVLKTRVLGNVSSKSRGASTTDENDVDQSFFNSSTPSVSAFGSCISKKKSRHRRRQRRWNAPKGMDLRKEMEEKLQSNPKFLKMQKIRQQLPVTKFREKVLKTVASSQVTLISAQTGAGKTTQVPQFLLEELGEKCNIVCTQPRRLAAIGVSQRVADERCESCGDVVGYSIRGESKTSARTRLLFCTTGVLLRRLQYSGTDGITHVLIDEVHERGVDTDFLMCVLRDLLKTAKSLKIVLMSATLNAKKFSEYYDSCPIIEIPGRTFPVTEHYLEDVWQLLEREDEMKMKSAIDYEVIASLTVHITRTTKHGAILIFMPGVGEISKLVSMIQRRVEDSAWVLPLHGSLGSSDQRRVFQRPPKNVRKIVVSTNIAETSLTIDDVVYVVDSGRVKQMEYDSFNRMPKLVETWISRASADQRKGRAGRVKKGVCFRMYPAEYFRGGQFPAYQLPEIKRVPLENLCLHVKSLDIGRVPDIMAKMLDPPDRSSVRSAMDLLIEIGALSKNRSLLPLGQHLVSLPVSVRIGKALVYGAILKVWEPVVTICALTSSRPVFLSPAAKRDEARQAQEEFRVRGSDHLTLLNVYRAYLKARDRRRFCANHFLRYETLNSVKTQIVQFERSIRNLGIELSNENATKLPVVKAALCAGLYANIVKAVAPEQRYQHLVGAGAAISIDPSAKEIRFFCRNIENKDENDRIPRQRVFMHPSSVNFHEGKFPYQYLMFQEKVQTSKIFLRSTSTLPPYALLLCGGDVKVDYSENSTMAEVSIDGWIRFQTPARVAAIVKELRVLLSELLRRKIANPRLEIGSSPMIVAMSKLLMASGM